MLLRLELTAFSSFAALSLFSVVSLLFNLARSPSTALSGILVIQDLGVALPSQFRLEGSGYVPSRGSR